MPTTIAKALVAQQTLQAMNLTEHSESLLRVGSGDIGPATPITAASYSMISPIADFPDDPAGTTYVQNVWATADGWSAVGGGTVSVNGGSLLYNHTAGYQYVSKSLTFPVNSHVRVRVRIVSGSPGTDQLQVFWAGAGGDIFKTIMINGSWNAVDVIATGASPTFISFCMGSYTNSAVYSLEIDWIYIGTGQYLSLLTDDTNIVAKASSLYRVTPVSAANGKYGLAFDKDLGSYAQLPMSVNFGANRSISCWIYIPSSYVWETTGSTWIVGGADSVGIGISRGGSSNTIEAYVKDSTVGTISVGAVISRDVWIHVVVVYRGAGDRKVDLYINGVKVNTSSTAMPADTSTYSPIYMGRGLAWGSSTYYFTGSISNVRIYDTALTQADVTYLYNYPDTMTPNASSFGSFEFTEKAALPTGAYYFPLQYNAKGYAPTDTTTPSINPVTATCVFDEQGAWVGSSKTNLWTVQTDLWGWISDTGTLTYNDVTPLGKYVKQILTMPAYANTHTASASNSLALTSGTSYTVSAYYIQSAGSNMMTPTHMELVKAGQATISKTAVASNILTPSDFKWQRAWTSATYNETVTAYPYIRFYPTNPATIKIGGLQIESTPFPTPWVLGSRPSGLLTYNLYRDIGLAWNADYTIIYWKKAIGTHEDTVSSGYSIDSIGKSGGGYVWWGKQTTSGMTYGFMGSAGGTIDTYSKFQHKWLMHALRRSGTTMTLRVYGYNEVPTLWFSSNRDDSSAVTANYYVATSGRDLQLGGWSDNTAPCNSYYRDLVVLKSALTDNQIDAYYKATMQGIAGGTELTVANLEEVL